MHLVNVGWLAKILFIDGIYAGIAFNYQMMRGLFLKSNANKEWVKTIPLFTKEKQTAHNQQKVLIEEYHKTPTTIMDATTTKTWYTRCMYMLHTYMSIYYAQINIYQTYMYICTL